MEPDSDWAREGVVESLKARHLVYRWILLWKLSMSRLSNRDQWYVNIASLVGIRFLHAAGKANPELAPLVLPITIAYFTFVILTWLADPIFNLLLRFNRYGRLSLTPNQISSSNWIGGVLALGLLLILMACAMQSVIVFLAAIATGFLALPVSGIFCCESGWPRRWMTVYTLVLVGFLAGGFAYLTVKSDLAIILFCIFAVGVILSGHVANGLSMARLKR